jgi:hypothetical protein
MKISFFFKDQSVINHNKSHLYLIIDEDPDLQKRKEAERSLSSLYLNKRFCLRSAY